MTTLVNTLLAKAQTILMESGAGVRWPRAELIGWLNDGYREVVMVRPDANSKIGTFLCDQGTRQTLDKPHGGFPDAVSLLDVTRNVSRQSLLRGVKMVDRAWLDGVRIGWAAEPVSLNIEFAVFDKRQPREFMTYPPAARSAELEVVYSAIPAPHDTGLPATDTTETLRLSDIYANALLDYILFRAFTKDSESASSGSRALVHYQAMANAIGVKTQTDAAAAPR